MYSMCLSGTIETVLRGKMNKEKDLWNDNIKNF